MPKLNILPKKSWHVYSSDNREKVRRDEEKARIEEEKEEQRRLKYERDFRLETMRNRAKDRQGDSNGDTVYANSQPTTTSSSKHINLFEDQASLC